MPIIKQGCFVKNNIIGFNICELASEKKFGVVYSYRVLYE